jgi:hypothetical protein
MGHFTLYLSLRVEFLPKGYFCWDLIVIPNLCAKIHIKLIGDYLIMIFLKFNVKKALSTTLVFEKCQAADFIFFLSS